MVKNGTDAEAPPPDAAIHALMADPAPRRSGRANTAFGAAPASHHAAPDAARQRSAAPSAPTGAVPHPDAHYESPRRRFVRHVDRCYEFDSVPSDDDGMPIPAASRSGFLSELSDDQAGAVPVRHFMGLSPSRATINVRHAGTMTDDDIWQPASDHHHRHHQERETQATRRDAVNIAALHSAVSRIVSAYIAPVQAAVADATAQLDALNEALKNQVGKDAGNVDVLRAGRKRTRLL